MFETLLNQVDWDLAALIATVATPIISFLAFIVYGAALFTSMQQNKITTSSSMIHKYDEEIEDQYKYGSQNLVGYGRIQPPITLTAFNCFREFENVLEYLNNSEQMKKDVNAIENETYLHWRYMEERDYYPECEFMASFFDPYTPINIYFARVKTLIQEIEKSSLIGEHKRILKRKIRRKLLPSFLIDIVDVRYTGADYPRYIPYIDRNNEVQLGDYWNLPIFKLNDYFEKHLRNT